jgi:hypothetical protein
MVLRMRVLAMVQLVSGSEEAGSVADVAANREGLAAQLAAIRHPFWISSLRLSKDVPPYPGAACRYLIGAMN